MHTYQQYSIKLFGHLSSKLFNYAKKESLIEGKRERETSKLRERSPATVAIFLYVFDEFLVFIRSPWSLL
jgi:hypothetical protein